MRQVPHGKTYTLIGSGRLAHHLKHLLTSKGVSFNQWSRNKTTKINTSKLNIDEALSNSTDILLAISDDSLPEFISKYKGTHNIIHFSGAYYSEDAVGAHPLMTFSDNLYEDSFYETIPFIIDQDLQLKDVLDNFSNPYHYIKPELKPLYHSYCTMSGNFTQILWQSMLNNFQKNINLPSSVLLPFMEKTFENLKNSEQALTGPFVRGDMDTINKHLKTLNNTNENELYKSFLNYFININGISKLEPLQREKK